MKFYTSLMIAFLCTACQNPNTSPSAVIPSKTNELIPLFEEALGQLNTEEINSLDLATSLFGEFVNRTDDALEKDKLFMPYFNFYNHGRKLLLQQEQAMLQKYGFRKIGTEENTYLVPVESTYLKEHVIRHLSEPMQQFCIQQLREFETPKDLSVLAARTLWWENFNTKNPNFFLKEMTTFHYKNWHLKNLLAGTKDLPTFNRNGKLSKEASDLYKNILKQNPNTNTAKTISAYLEKLRESKMKKTDEILSFLKAYQ